MVEEDAQVHESPRRDKPIGNKKGDKTAQKLGIQCVDIRTVKRFRTEHRLLMLEDAYR